jgi:hypothetical protein
MQACPQASLGRLAAAPVATQGRAFMPDNGGGRQPVIEQYRDMSSRRVHAAGRAGAGTWRVGQRPGPGTEGRSGEESGGEDGG